MIDKLKSLLLGALIVASMFQTYSLIYSTPKYEPIAQGSDYVKTEKLGEKIEASELLFPDQMVFHLGDGKHTLLYRDMGHFNLILGSIKQRSFDSFKRINPFLMDVNWEDIRNKRKGIELHFREGVSLSVLQQMFQIGSTFGVDNDRITNIWMFMPETGDEVRTIFFTDTRSEGYEVKTNLTAKDIEKMVGWGMYADEYYTTTGDYYLPLKPVKTYAYRFSYTTITDDQLRRILFVDPGIVRSLKERDGSQIYTDGKKGLQINREKHWFTYTDPIAPVEDTGDVWDNLLAGVQFINQRGGWNGAYGLSGTPPRNYAGVGGTGGTGATTGKGGIGSGPGTSGITGKVIGNGATDGNPAGTGGVSPGSGPGVPAQQPPFKFRQYYGSYPIVQPANEGFGLMKISMQKGYVTSFERSLLIPDTKSLVQTETPLIAGEQLEAKLKQLPNRYSIVSVFPAYRAVESEAEVELQPVWALQYRDGNYGLLE